MAISNIVGNNKVVIASINIEVAETLQISSAPAIISIIATVTVTRLRLKLSNILNFDKHDQMDKLIGFCMMIKKEVINKIGLLDENFLIGNFEDDDYCLRMRKAGYKLILCKDTFIHHFGSISFKNTPTLDIFEISEESIKVTIPYNWQHKFEELVDKAVDKVVDNLSKTEKLVYSVQYLIFTFSI